MFIVEQVVHMCGDSFVSMSEFSLVERRAVVEMRVQEENWYSGEK
jgi:hypothetical protein